MTTLPSGFKLDYPQPRYLTEEEKQARDLAELRALRLEQTCRELNISPGSPMAELTQWIQDNSTQDPHEFHCYFMASENATYQWLDNHWQRYSWADQEWRPVCLHDPSGDPSQGLNIAAAVFAVLAVIGLVGTGRPGWLIGLVFAGFLLLVNKYVPRGYRGWAILGGVVATSLVLGHLNKKSARQR